MNSSQGRGPGSWRKSRRVQPHSRDWESRELYRSFPSPSDRGIARFRATRLTAPTFLATLVLAFLTPRILHAAAPPNDLFANRIALEGTDLTVTGSNVDATRERNEPAHNGETYGNSVWWSWTAAESGFVTLSTEGSRFDTVLTVFTGNTLDRLTFVGLDDDGGPNFTSKLTLPVVAGNHYNIAVDGYAEDGIADNGPIRLRLIYEAQRRAPAWTLYDIDGKEVSSANYSGQVVLLNFWATWCGPCIAEIPGMIQLQDRYRAQGFSIVGISLDEGGPRVVRPFIPRHNLNYQIVMSNADVESDYGPIEFIPTSFLIDRDGNLIDKFVGNTSEAVFEAGILPLLKPAEPPRLSHLRRGNRLVLAWPADQPGVRIQSSGNPAGPWSDSPVTGVSTNGQIEAVISSEAAAVFFRLRR